MLNIASIKPLVVRGISSSTFALKKHSPEILTGIGIVGVVAAGVIASRATLKLTEVLDRRKDDLTTSKELFAESGEEEYSVKDHKEDVAKIYIRSSIEVARLYGPSILLGVAAIGCIVGGHGLLRRRNVALAASAKALEAAFAGYRKRVKEEFGEEKEREIRQNVRDVEIETSEGKKITVRQPGIGNSPYARLFDHRSDRWQSSVQYNLFFLQGKERIFNQILQAEGRLFLNDVYKELGLPISRDGQLVGWSTDGDGDGYVSFGIFEDYYKDGGENFNNFDRVILVDFNVDGEILSGM